MSHDYSILPEGYIFGYVSEIKGITENEYGEWDYDFVTVSNIHTGDYLFTIDAEQGSGDYRGFPACVYAMPSLNEEMYNAVAPYLRGDDDEEEIPYGDMWREWHHLDGVFEIQFILRDNEDDRYDTDSPYRYDFVGWLPTDDDFDLAEELENMDVELLRDFEVKVSFRVKAKSGEDAEEKVCTALEGNELRWETDEGSPEEV